MKKYDGQTMLRYSEKPEMPDYKKAIEHFSKCMVELGLDPASDPSLAETPERVVCFLADATSNYKKNPSVTRVPIYDRDKELKLTTFKADGLSQMVFEGGMHFSSICAHHFLPFYGTAYVGYVPDMTILGLSKFPRIVDFFAKAPNTQEYLTKAILDYTVETLNPWFAMVMLKAQHTCVSCRGPFKPTAQTITTSIHGRDFPDRTETSKQEFLRYVTMV